jgi:hypothetical protein
MNQQRTHWNGARWWKFDLHSHTPASADYGKGSQQAALRARTPEEWLLDYMRAKVDCVVVTDHNTGAWVDPLKQALADLAASKLDEFRPLHLFPGVEISVNGGVHVLAILGMDKTTSDIDSLLGAVGFSGTKGSSDSVTSRTFQEVVTEIARSGGIAVPAHADCDNGLFKLTGTTLIQALECPEVFAIEVVDPSSTGPPSYEQAGRRWTELVGSDTHHPSGQPGQRYPGSHFAWVKMGAPNIDGLRLGLRDGPLSVRRSDSESGDPNEHASLVLESIEVSGARYIGRADPFTLDLNPWLNAIVGGRGTGKSTTVEFLRLALGREGELPEELSDEFDKYATSYENRDDSGLLTADASIVVTYWKDGARFRIERKPASGQAATIHEHIDGQWQASEGDVVQRFPVRIYSQKQIFQLAKTPLALLRIVDDAPAVGRRAWEERWRALTNQYLSLQARIRELSSATAEESRLKGDLDDVTRKLTVFEASGHAEVLSSFRRSTRQGRAVEVWTASWSAAGDRLRELAAEIVPGSLEVNGDDSDTGNEALLRAKADEICEQLATIRGSLESLATQVDEVRAQWGSALEASSWKTHIDGVQATYRALVQRLKEEAVGDPEAYEELVKRRQEIEDRLQGFEDRRAEIEELGDAAITTFGELLEHRRKLTESRRTFLGDVLSGNEYVQIQVEPYGARDTVEAELRKLLQREQGGFERDIGWAGGEGMLGQLYSGGENGDPVENRLAELKRRLREIATGVHDPKGVGDQRFAKHVQSLPPEALDRLDLWFPEDSLEVSYSPTGDRTKFRPIAEGSPGQKTAALLAFLLSYGDEPLVLDQPEDDLDNHLIYDLIVTQLREVKRRRQVLVVSHNSNIVVNGDAELVCALVVRGGQTQKECEGCLQETKVRDSICNVMEGGRAAFEQRYRRIALGGRTEG